MADIVVATACYGAYDVLRAQAAQDVEADWVCFTDDAHLAPPPPWRALYVPSTCEHPRMAAKPYKMSPWGFWRHYLWVDANTEVTHRSFVRQALAARRNGLALFRHPQRRCIYDEAEACEPMPKYRGQPVAEQVAHYRAEGHPARAGLYAGGTIAWDWAEPGAVAVGRAWLAEIERWSYQDQLSLPVVLRRLGVRPGVFPVRQIERRGGQGGWLGNRWLRIHPHRSDA